MSEALFVQMFGDPNEQDHKLPVGRLENLGTLDRGVSKHRPRNAPGLLNGPYPFVQTGDVTNSGGYITSCSASYSDLGLRQSRMWKAGTLCVTIAANIARVGILTFDACFPDSVVGFQAREEAIAEYVRIWFGFVQKRLEDAAPESTQKNINLAILRAFPIAIPPIEHMRLFASRVEQINDLAKLVRRSKGEIDALFASLQHRAFSGEL